MGPRGGVRYARNSGCLVARSSIGVNLFSKRVCSAVAWLAHARILFHCQNGGKIKYFWLIAFRSFPDVSSRVQLCFPCLKSKHFLPTRWQSGSGGGCCCRDGRFVLGRRKLQGIFMIIGAVAHSSPPPPSLCVRQSSPSWIADGHPSGASAIIIERGTER